MNTMVGACWIVVLCPLSTQYLGESLVEVGTVLATSATSTIVGDKLPADVRSRAHGRWVNIRNTEKDVRSRRTSIDIIFMPCVFSVFKNWHHIQQRRGGWGYPYQP
jgi:hypothetical protein